MADTEQPDFLSEYYANLATDKEIAMDYLHQTVSWQITIFIGGVIAVVSQLHLPSTTSLLVLSLMIVSTIHFALRSAKAYLNLTRWSLIERRYLSGVGNVPEQQRRESILQAIELYHHRWQSPLRKRTIIYKVIFELGYGFQLAALIALAIYCFPTGSVCAGVLIAGVAMAAVVVELYCNFWTSPYFRQILPDSEATQLR